MRSELSIKLEEFNIRQTLRHSSETKDLDELKKLNFSFKPNMEWYQVDKFTYDINQYQERLKK